MAGTAKLTATGNPYVDGLLLGTKWTGTLSFSFTDSPLDYPTSYGRGEHLTNYAQVSVADMQAMRAMLLGTPKAGVAGNAMLQGQGVAQFTQLNIIDAGSNGADIRIGQSSKPGTAYTYSPGPIAGGEIWLGTAYAGTVNDLRNPVLGNYAYLTLAHELGQGTPGANRVFETLWDGGGHDSFDLSNYSGGVNVDLSPGGWSVLAKGKLAALGAGHYAKGNVYNAMLYHGDTRWRRSTSDRGARCQPRRIGCCRICCGSWLLSSPIRSGASTSPMCRCGVASCTWWR